MVMAIEIEETEIVVFFPVKEIFKEVIKVEVELELPCASSSPGVEEGVVVEGRAALLLGAVGTEHVIMATLFWI